MLRLYTTATKSLRQTTKSAWNLYKQPQKCLSQEKTLCLHKQIM